MLTGKPKSTICGVSFQPPEEKKKPLIPLKGKSVLTTAVLIASYSDSYEAQANSDVL